ncbi:NUDIX domain-containing protein [Candidatus Daviesbacteria bacterium]|nr:NUDIX domain-containing protein [Candidatus Daviesbacteria bacterium]
MNRGGKRFAIAFVLTSESEVVFVREPKYGQMGFFISLPTGGAKKGEALDQAAGRELLEETGYQCPQSLVQISQKPLIDFADKIDGADHEVYFGLNATQVQQPETLREVVLLTPAQAREAAVNGDIRIAMTISALFLGLEHLQRARA